MSSRWAAPSVGAVLLLAGAVGGATHVVAQGLESRVRGAGGTVAFHYDIREDVEVCDHGIIVDGERRVHWRGRRDDESCSIGVAEAVLTVRDGEVLEIDLEAWEGPGTAPSGATDLGEAAPAEVAELFLGLARSGRDREAAEEGIFAATLARDVVVWPRLLELARDRDVDRDVRSAAVFWTGQAAADAATQGLAALAADDEEDQEVRDAAVFALSQRPDEEAVPVLMELARTAREARTRRSAMFWLAQSDDPRVLAFFEEILASGGG